MTPTSPSGAEDLTIKEYDNVRLREYPYYRTIFVREIADPQWERRDFRGLTTPTRMCGRV